MVTGLCFPVGLVRFYASQKVPWDYNIIQRLNKKWLLTKKFSRRSPVFPTLLAGVPLPNPPTSLCVFNDRLSVYDLPAIVRPDPKPDHDVARQHAKNARVTRDVSRAKLVAVGKSFDRLEFDARRAAQAPVRNIADVRLRHRFLQIRRPLVFNLFARPM
jgi:hypothetical protein